MEYPIQGICNIEVPGKDAVKVFSPGKHGIRTFIGCHPIKEEGNP